ncbi:adenine-specific methyltransferase EcoRI family protein [Blautia sp. 1033sp1_1033st1_G9_1033SCRN_220408]|uniref:adenine-specific methyltransferase EcoRI family protein n=1 Tax=Blautia sp. 1033sp1_1033st1_G9_1033SCRN_220408 TaxID=3144490 RepID=UPI0034A14A77
MANESLHKAKTAKNDEFYTRLTDVAEELRHYKKHFRGKTVLCNCDDPTWSAFWKYFHLNFEELDLKKIISTHYDIEKPTYKMEYTGGDDDNIESGVKTPLEGNGDFRSQECLDLLSECDIVVTNPPFSIARESYVPLLFKYKKKFIIIGDLNWVTYKFIFPLLKENKMWMGCSNVKAFIQPDGSIKKFGNKLWYTNLDIKKRHENIILWKKYSSDSYHKYDNYDAINVDKVSEIPCDYCESWKVTEEELLKLNSLDWEIVREQNECSIKILWIIPASGTELRKILSQHSNGYKEKIEEKLKKCLTSDDEKTTLLQWTADRYCNGIFGVPITFFGVHNSKQFEIIGATESEGKGFSQGLWISESEVAQPLVESKRKYKRLFTRKIL